MTSNAYIQSSSALGTVAVCVLLVGVVCVRARQRAP